MSYTITQAPTGGTQIIGPVAQNTQQADAANSFMTNWEKQNPTGYADDRSFMVADSKGYWDYQNRRKAAYDGYLAQQKPQTAPQNPAQPVQVQAAPNGNTGFTGAGMPIIQSAMSPGSVNQIAQAQTQGYAAVTNSGATPVGAQTMQATQQPAQTMQATQQQPQAQTMQAPAPTGTQGGIIQKQIGQNVGADGQITGVDTYNAAQLGDATKWNVTSEQTMQGQLGNILKDDSMLMQMARARAMEDMNARGLANSSLAIGAGQRAMAEVAMPIAQNDAGVHAQAAGYNADIENIFKQQNVGWQNQALAFGAEQSNLANRTNAQNRTNTNIAREQNETTRWTAQLDSDTRKGIAQLDSDTRRYIADQDVGVRRELGYLDADVRREGYASNERMNALDNDTQRYGIDTNAAVTREGYRWQDTWNSRDNDTRRYGIDVGAAVQREGYSVQRELGYLDANTRTNIANMSNATQVAVAQMGHEYQAQLQSSVNAQNMFNNMSAQIAAIDRDPNLSVDGKRNAIQRQMSITRDALGVMGDVANVPNLGYYYGGGYVS